MKKVKLEERFENAVNAFFESETFDQQNAIVLNGNEELVQISPAQNLAEKADKYFGLFKKIFAFLPGILFLHLVVPGIFTFGIGVWTLFFLAAGIFMVWAGIGDLKNKKHILLPMSAMLIAFLFSIPFYFLSPQIIVDYYVYLYIGILPLLFIAPILTKDLLNKNENREKKI